jgi:hypothetical protein
MITYVDWQTWISLEHRVALGRGIYLRVLSRVYPIRHVKGERRGILEPLRLTTRRWQIPDGPVRCYDLPTDVIESFRGIFLLQHPMFLWFMFKIQNYDGVIVDESDFVNDPR